MIAEYRQRTNLGVGLGIVLHLAGGYMISHGMVMGSLVALVGSILFIWGCCNYAMGKGYAWPVGLLGLLSCIGLLVLIVLPDKSGTAV